MLNNEQEGKNLVKAPVRSVSLEFFSEGIDDIDRTFLDFFLTRSIEKPVREIHNLQDRKPRLRIRTSHPCKKFAHISSTAKNMMSFKKGYPLT